MENNYTIALFGEAEKGKYNTAYHFDSLPELLENLGNPPPESKGLYYAVQVLLFQRNLIFFRVEEEGFSYQDYFLGLRMLEKDDPVTNIAAICLPGVGDAEIIDAAIPLCHLHKSIIVTTEPDLYDYLTEHSSGPQ